MGGLIHTKSDHKAVAPIIATLLMVAIAVVGGILIFVFTQGFFADEQVVGPTVDNFRIFGYNATDAADFAGAINGDNMGCAASEKDNILDDGDCITIFIENIGDKAIAIQAVRLFGVTYSPDTGTITNGVCPTSVGKFTMYDDTDNTQVAISVLEPNHKGVICVAFAEAQSDEVDAGKQIPVQVQTVNGQSAQLNMINGAARGVLSD